MKKLFVFFAAAVLLAQTLQATTYYVSKSGSDSNGGTSTNAAFLTISKAASLMSAGDTCYILSGTYRENVTPANSGTSGSPITFAAYAGATPIVSGADVIASTWSIYTNSIYECSTTNVVNQLFVDGYMMNIARWPNANVNELLYAPRSIPTSCTLTSVTDNNLPSGLNLLGAYVQFFSDELGNNGYTANTRLITGWNSSSKTFSWVTDVHQADQTGCLYYVYDALSLLDIPTEWYQTNTTLYLWAPDNASPATHIVETKNRTNAFTLNNLSYVTLSNISVFAAGISMVHTTNCVVNGCNLTYVQHDLTADYNRDVLIANNVSGTGSQWINSVIDYSSQDGIRLSGTNEMVSNCVIYNVDYYPGTYYANVSPNSTNAGGNTVINNTLWYSGRYNVGDSSGGNNNICSNDMAYGMLRTSDGGAFYAYGNGGNGTIIHHNWAHNGFGGIYLDYNQNGFVVYCNLCYSNNDGCVFNQGSNNLIINNTMVSNYVWDIIFAGGSDVNVQVYNNIWNANNNQYSSSTSVSNNGWYPPLGTNYIPLTGSGAINGGLIDAPYTDGYVGSAPDIGAFVGGSNTYFVPGANFVPKSFPLSVTTYEDIVLGDHPVSYWPMQETTGPTIYDIASGNNGTLVTSTDGTSVGLGQHTAFTTAGSGSTDGATYLLGGPGGLAGVPGDTAIYFTNLNTSTNNSQIVVPYNANSNTAIDFDPSSALTAEAWIKVPSYPIGYTNTAYQTPLGLEANGGVQNGWWMALKTDSSSSKGDIQFNLALSPGSGWDSPSSTSSLAGTWVYAVEVYTNLTLLCYTNGVLVTNAAMTTNYESEVLYGSHELPFVIGSYCVNYSGGGTLADGYERGDFWHGAVSHVAIYNTALTASQITNHYYYGTNFIGAAPAIVTQPASQTNYFGQTNTFFSGASGAPPPAYQWRVEVNGVYSNLNNGGQFSGVTNSALTISDLVAGNATNYEVVMTNSFGSVTSAVATLTVAHPPYQTIILDDGPTAYWPMQETNGPTLYDIVGGYDGTLVTSTDNNIGLGYHTNFVTARSGATDGKTYLLGGPGGLASTPGDTAIYFTNLNTSTSNSQIVVAYNAALDPSTNLTAEAWIKVPSYPISYTNTTFQVPMGLEAFGGAENGWWMAVETDSSGSEGDFQFNIAQYPGSWLGSPPTTTSSLAGNWVYAVEVYTGSNSNLLCYTNGVLMATVAMTSYYESEGLYGTHKLPFVIGSYSSPGGGSGGYNGGGTLANGFERGDFWHGGISHVALYAYALTATQITNHYYYGTNGSSGSAPSITSQPASATNYATQTATFTVGASGTAPLAYQWKVESGGSYVNLSNGGQFSGVTTATLSISSLVATNATNYEVVVTNSFGTATSAAATLTVLPAAPSITTQPANTTNNAGQTATFSVTAAGLPTLSYQWQVESNGSYANLANAGQFSGVTTSTLTISSLVTNNATNYEVVVTNSAGSITSAAATLTVLAPPSITAQPASTTNYTTQTATFTVSASGASPLSYQWKVDSNGSYVNLSNGGQFSGATSATLSISSLALTNATNYEVVVTNSYGSVTSSAATLTVLNAIPSITTQPASQTNNAGQTATFTVAAAGLAPLSYQWRVEANGSYANLANAGQFSGVTNTTLTISNVALTNATNYDVLVTNSAGSVTSSAALLTVLCYQTVILGDAPVSYWPMQETTGPTIKDIITTNAGPFNGTVQISTDGFTNGGTDGEGKSWGIIHETFTNSTSAVATDGATYLFGGPGGLAGMSGDTAVYFTNLNGQLNSVQIAMGTNGTGVYESQLDSSTFSVEAWIKVPTYTIGWTSNSYQIPLALNAYGNAGGTANGWFMGVKTDSSGSGAYGEMFFDAGTGTAFTSNGPSAQDFSGKWVYAVQEYNGTATVIYTNGNLMVSNTQTYKPLSNTSAHEEPFFIGSETAYYFGGSTFSGNTRADFWDGGVSHLAYYNYALAASHITNHYYYGTNSSFGMGGAPHTPVLPTFKPTIETTPATPISAALTPTLLSGSSSKQFQMQVSAVPNQNYTLQMCTDLSSGNWVSLYTTNSTTNTSFVLTDPEATNKQRFYRVLIGP